MAVAVAWTTMGTVTVVVSENANEANLELALRKTVRLRRRSMLTVDGASLGLDDGAAHVVDVLVTGETVERVPVGVKASREAEKTEQGVSLLELSRDGGTLNRGGGGDDEDGELSELHGGEVVEKEDVGGLGLGGVRRVEGGGRWVWREVLEWCEEWKQEGIEFRSHGRDELAIIYVSPGRRLEPGIVWIAGTFATFATVSP